jgi:uncharacterized membrane protein YfhO
VVPGPAAHLAGEPGSSFEVSWSANEVRARIVAPDDAVVLLQREYAPIYRASLNGRRVAVTVANATRLAVEVPAGEHDLRVWVERRPFFWSLLGAPVGLVVLLLWARRERREGESSAEPADGAARRW